MKKTPTGSPDNQDKKQITKQNSSDRDSGDSLDWEKAASEILQLINTEDYDVEEDSKPVDENPEEDTAQQEDVGIISIKGNESQNRVLN